MVTHEERLERMRIYARKYREAHRDEIRAYQKAYRAAHKAERAAYQLAYYRENPEHFAIMQKESRRRRAEQNGPRQRLIDYRRTHSLDQRDLAKLVGVSAMTVSNWERGVCKAPLDKLAATLPGFGGETDVQNL